MRSKTYNTLLFNLCNDNDNHPSIPNSKKQELRKALLDMMLSHQEEDAFQLIDKINASQSKIPFGLVDYFTLLEGLQAARHSDGVERLYLKWKADSRKFPRLQLRTPQEQVWMYNHILMVYASKNRTEE